MAHSLLTRRCLPLVLWSFAVSLTAGCSSRSASEPVPRFDEVVEAHEVSAECAALKDSVDVLEQRSGFTPVRLQRGTPRLPQPYPPEVHEAGELYFIVPLDATGHPDTAHLELRKPYSPAYRARLQEWAAQTRFLPAEWKGCRLPHEFRLVITLLPRRD